METTKGTAETAPSTRDKVTNFSTDTQAVEQSLAALRRVAENQREPEADRSAVGMLTVKTANDWIKEAARRPRPKQLYRALWYQNELACLFADTNLGKSILAVQIANEIAERQRVIYFDFELSDSQFGLRYTNEDGQLFRFSDNVLRAEISSERFNPDNFEEQIIDNISEALRLNDAKVAIIDNLTFLASAAEDAKVAGNLMIKLNALKKRENLSLLIVSHTPKRSMSNPLTINDLAGSKRLANFFDSIFAIGKSAMDDNLRYIKQLKTRNGAFAYGAENVITTEVVKEDCFLMLRETGFSTERQHLIQWDDAQRDEINNNILTLGRQGMSQRQIAAQLGISVGKVNKVLKQ
jgi:predicted ATP-dependent serine protease